MKLTNFEIHFDEISKELYVIKTPNENNERAAVLEIRPTTKYDLENLIDALSSGDETTIAATIRIQVNKE